MVNVFQQASASAVRVFDFLREPEQENEIEKKHIELEKVFGNIEFRNVDFGYQKDKMIIQNFNATIKKGQKIAIVGPTGAGKTTLVNLLMRFYDIQGGDIFIDGKSIKNMKREEVQSLYAMVLQDTLFYK